MNVPIQKPNLMNKCLNVKNLRCLFFVTNSGYPYILPVT